jgi:two-component system phosphate regulon response regulator PhoB
MTKAQPRSNDLDQGARGHILVVEDEKDLQDLLRYNLTREGYSVTCTALGEQALRISQDRLPDLILLDLMLPDLDGLEVCRAIKADPVTSRIPIVMLTAKGEEADVVVGLEMGADDYLPKPFSPRVLVARLRAVLRRGETEVAQEQDPPVRVNEIEINPSRHEVRVAGQPIELTATEFKLLYLLARRPGRVFTRQSIIDAIHDGFAAVTDRSVDVQVVALRRKLGSAGQQIQTVRGVGYRLKE